MSRSSGLETSLDQDFSHQAMRRKGFPLGYIGKTESESNKIYLPNARNHSYPNSRIKLPITTQGLSYECRFKLLPVLVPASWDVDIIRII